MYGGVGTTSTEPRCRARKEEDNGTKGILFLRQENTGCTRSPNCIGMKLTPTGASFSCTPYSVPIHRSQQSTGRDHNDIHSKDRDAANPWDAWLVLHCDPGRPSLGMSKTLGSSACIDTVPWHSPCCFPLQAKDPSPRCQAPFCGGIHCVRRMLPCCFVSWPKRISSFLYPFSFYIVLCHIF